MLPFFMRSPMQRKYAAKAAHGGAASREDIFSPTRLRREKAFPARLYGAEKAASPGVISSGNLLHRLTERNGSDIFIKKDVTNL